MDQDSLKEQAGLRALEEVQSGMTLGLGTGTTVYWFLKHLGEALNEDRLQDVAGVPTSERTAVLCREFDIPVISLTDEANLDLSVDGADEIDPNLELVKGLGAALLREKMVATASRHFIVVADKSKLVDRLGERAPLPVEIVRFEWRWQLGFFESLGATPALRHDADGRPMITDNGNFLVDCRFASGIDDPVRLARQLEERPGVVDHGLFLGYADRAIVAAPQGLRVIDRPT